MPFRYINYTGYGIHASRHDINMVPRNYTGSQGVLKVTLKIPKY